MATVDQETLLQHGAVDAAHVVRDETDGVGFVLLDAVEPFIEVLGGSA